MQHIIKIHPQLTDRYKVLTYIARCSCGYQSPVCETQRDANRDADAHTLAVSIGENARD